jgi:CHAT domain-containing protein
MRADDIALKCFCGLVQIFVLCAFTVTAPAETPSFIAPPRTIADISTILEQEKADPERIASQQAKANAVPPSTGDRRVLAQFYFNRAEMRGRLGRVREALADIEQSISYAQGVDALLARSLVLLGQLHGWSGDTKQSLEAFTRAESFFRADRRYNVTRWIGIDWIALGDLDQAERSMQANREALAKAEKKTDWATDPFRSSAEAHVAFGNAAILEARGEFHEAAVAYERAEDRFRDSLTRLSEIPNPPMRTSVEQVCDWMVARAARVKAREGRLTEAEADVRRALLGWLKLSGKYDLNTARIIDVFAMILVEQGRFAEAETLARTVIEIYQALGIERDSQVAAISLTRLAGILALQGKWADAAKTYALVDAATIEWEQPRKDEIEVDVTRIVTYYNVNDVDRGIAAAKRLVSRQVTHFGEYHSETALARGMLAMGLVRAGHDTEALKEFKAATPILASSRDTQSEEDDAVGAAAREQRVQSVIESYIGLLARAGRDGSIDAFQLAEGIRGRSVQKAIAASAARAVADDPTLAELARREQDLGKQASAQLGLLSNTLARPPQQRDDRAVNDLRAAIEHLHRERAAAQREIAQKFPDYAALIRPQPPTIEQIQSVLKPGEAFLSFYLGQEASYVWAVPQQGTTAFAAIPLSAAEIGRKITSLRAALEPNASTIDEIPPFDVALAHQLYTLLLKPVEAGWRPAKNLLVATNGALGLLPLGLLPTAASEIKANVEPQFAGYRDVPWLARSHAVTLVPSASALRTLRQLPPGSDRRERLIGFGDPLFNAEQATEAEHQHATIQVAAATITRGIPLKRRAAPQVEGADRVELASLPRLPDTAEELKSVALALETDPAKVLHLGKDANEMTVKNTDLSRYKIVVFATHGLVPGELDGLHQPALALTAPDVAGVPGDGLLTMDKILGLKFDADWIVLSACNTGAGAGTGAEAASGLGRAFFYAGTRAILVTNWSVHSQSARELVTDLFRRQAADAKISRSEALRQAMMDLLDSHGFRDDDGKTLFTYGHPLFWAPYTIIGDAG